MSGRTEYILLDLAISKAIQSIPHCCTSVIVLEQNFCPINKFLYHSLLLFRLFSYKVLYTCSIILGDNLQKNPFILICQFIIDSRQVESLIIYIGLWLGLNIPFVEVVPVCSFCLQPALKLNFLLEHVHHRPCVIGHRQIT